MLEDATSFLRKPLVSSLIRYIAAIVSALLMASAFPPYHFGWIAWFGLVPFFLAIWGLKRLQTYTIVATWMVVFFACTIDFWLIHRSPVFDLILVLSFIVQTVIVSESQLLSARFRSWGWLLFSGLWISITFLVMFLVGLIYPLPPDLPLYSFANTQWLYPTMLQILPITGESGLALLIVVFNQGLVQVVLHRQRREWLMPMALVVSLLIICAGWGTYHLSVDKPKETVGVAIVTGENGSEILGSYQTERYLQSITGKTSLQDGSAVPDIGIVVWPESPVGDLSPDPNPVWLSSLASQINKYLVTDFIKSQVKGLPLNEAVVTGPDGSILAVNAKRKIPPIIEDHEPADKKTSAVVVTTPWGRMSTLVCYDVFFPDVVRKEVNQGVDYIVVPANAIYNSPRVTAIQLAQTMLRAAENHTAVAFAFNNGTSALIDSNGRLLTHEVLYSLNNQNNDIGMMGTLPIETGGTLYTKIGDLFIWMVLVGCIAGLFIGIIHIAKRNY